MTGPDASYGEGERVFGPPQGTYDADWVASSAREAGPSDPAEISRRLLADHPQDGATAANVVAVAAVQFCAAYEVDPQA